jgi:hypothetical protein
VPLRAAVAAIDPDPSKKMQFLRPIRIANHL